MIYEIQFLFSLLLTIIIETVILFIVIRRLLKITNKSISNNILFFLGSFCSFSTLPYLWFLLPFFIHNYFYYVLIGEIFVIILESFIYYFILNIGYKKAFIVSFLCNLISFLIGLLISPITNII